MQLTNDESPNQLSRFSRIGLFDSGVGGLSVLRRLAQMAGERSFVYLGDTARCPYGNRDGVEIAIFVAQIVRWLEEQEVDAIVMACNTSAAMGKAAAEAAASVPVFDLITPTARALASAKEKIGVMATAATARSQAFSRAIKAINPCAQVLEVGCPELVPLVENGEINSPKALSLLTKYVARLAQEHVGTVILGCTHYPFLRRQLEGIAAGQIAFVDPAEILSGTKSHDLHPSMTCDMYTTGSASAFAAAAEICLGYIPCQIGSIEISTLERCFVGGLIAMPQETVSTATAAPVVP